MGSQEIVVNLQGLKTNTSRYLNNQGALLSAKNVNVDAPAVITSRRGFGDYFSIQQGLASETPRYFFDILGRTGFYTGSRLFLEDNAGVGDFVQIAAPAEADDTIGIRTLKSNSNALYTSDEGIIRWESANPSVKYWAGYPRGLSISVVANPAGSTLKKDGQYGYKVIWGKIDSDSIVHLGAPSEIDILTIDGGASDTDANVTIMIPDEVTIDWFVQIYRSKKSADDSTAPDDALQLAYEGNPTAAEILAGTMTVLDNYPDAVLGAYLYTNINRNAELINNANDRPPFATDITQYRDMTVYSGCRLPQNSSVNLLSVLNSANYATLGVGIADVVAMGNGTTTVVVTDSNKTVVDGDRVFIVSGNGGGGITISNEIAIVFASAPNVFSFSTTQGNQGNGTLKYFKLTSIVTGDTVTVDGIAYTAVEAAPAAQEFLISDSTDVAIAIRETAKSLVESINLNGGRVLAFYNSGFTDFPGQIYFEADDVSLTTFSVFSSNIYAFNPSCPNFNPIISSTNTQKNVIYFSKPGIPEAVPTGRYEFVGNSASAIIRCIALKESMFVFKDDATVWRIAGYSWDTLTIDLVDSNTQLVAPKTAVVFDNRITCFTDQCISTFSDNGLEITSFNIENLLKQFLSSVKNPDFSKKAWALAYDTDRRYIMSDGLTRMFCYNKLTDCFTTWEIPADGGYVNPYDDKMYYGTTDQVTDTLIIRQERKDFTIYDYCDRRETINIIAIDPTGLRLSINTPIIIDQTYVGWEILQGQNYTTIVAVDIPNQVLIIDEILQITALGAATINEPIDCSIVFSDLFAGSPAIMKNYQEVMVSFSDMNKPFDVEFYSNFQSGKITQNVNLSTLDAGWGRGLWGQFPWGGVAQGMQEYRVLYPLSRKKALSTKIGIRTKHAFTQFLLDAISLTFRPMTEIFVKRGS